MALKVTALLLNIDAMNGDKGELLHRKHVLVVLCNSTPRFVSLLVNPRFRLI